MNAKRPLPLHPLLYGLFAVLSLYSFNVAQAQAADLPLPLAMVLGGAVVLWLALWLALRDAAKSALILTLGLVVFFSYGHVYDALKYLKLGGFRIGRHRFLLLVSVGLFAMLAWAALKARAVSPSLTKLLNTTTAVLIGLTLLNAASYKLSHRQIQPVEVNAGTAFFDSSAIGLRRDVYFIILDGYGSRTTLRDVYDFDNSAFLDRLREFGFMVADNAFSNYNQTNISLPSIMRMDYMNFLEVKPGENSTDPSIPWSYLRRGAVWQRLREYGFRLILIRSGWGPTDRNDFVDEAVKCGRYNEFVKMLTHTTMLSVIERKLLVADWHRDNVRLMVQALEGMGTRPGPKFVFMHFPLPHAPFVFGAKGEPVEPPDISFGQNIWLPRERYVQQLQYVNALMLEAVEKILKESEETPVIVMLGDHGPASFDQWHAPSDDFLRERHGVLWAALLPDAETKAAPDKLTLVNTFRIVFNEEFHAGLSLLPNRLYHSTFEQPYRFLEVTDRLIGAEADGEKPDS